MGQIAFCRAEEHKITWAALSVLFQTAQSTLHGWLRRHEKQMAGEPIGARAHDVLDRPKSDLTKREEDIVLQWICDTQCEKTVQHPLKCVNLSKGSGNSESMTEDRVTGLGGTVSKAGILN
jgi:hypothetical protein